MRAQYVSFIPIFMLPFFLILSPSSYADREMKEAETQTFQMGPGGMLKITADEGSVRISSWDRSEVEIHMTKYARGKDKREAQRLLEEIEVAVEQSGNRLIIREREFEQNSYSILDLFDPDTWDRMSGHSTWIDFDIKVPRKIDLDIRTDEGDVTISDIEGEIEVETDESDVELYQISSNRVSVTSDEGDMFLENLRALTSSSSSRLVIDTDESDMELVNVDMERVEIDTDEGDVMAERLRCKNLDFYSDEGSIEAGLDILPDGDYRCQTDEGRIVLLLPGDASFSITARSQEGEIRSDFPIRIKEHDDGERVDDTVGDGDATIYLFVDEGMIRLREK